MKTAIYATAGIILLLCIGIGYTITSYKNNKIARMERCPKGLGTQTKPHSAPAQKRIVLIGDSRIQDWGKPDLGKDTEVINFGIGGATSRETLCQINDTMLNLSPEWYIVQVGINDIVAASMMKEHERIKIHEQLLENIRQIITKLSGTGSRILLLTIVPPISPDMLRSLVWGDTIEEDAARASKKLLDEFSTTAQVYDMKGTFFDFEKNTWKDELSRNALHWNEKAYRSLDVEIKRIVTEPNPQSPSN